MKAVNNTPPRPTSDSTTNDEITFVKNSGAIVETAMNVAAATSYTNAKLFGHL